VPFSGSHRRTLQGIRAGLRIEGTKQRRKYHIWYQMNGIPPNTATGSAHLRHYHLLWFPQPRSLLVPGMRRDRVELFEDHCHLYPTRNGREVKHNLCKMFME
jgi:hypothetical protein